MKPILQVRISPQLVLTPQLQQSIRLLQLSTLELEQEIEQMLNENPFLDAEESPFEHAFELLSERSLPTEQAAELEAERAQEHLHDEALAGSGLTELDRTDFDALERPDWENGTEGDDFDGIAEMPFQAGSSNKDDPPGLQNRGPASLCLEEHLRAQLHGMRLSPEDRGALHVLIDSLNEDGYLAHPLPDIAQSLGQTDEEREALLERLQCALKWLQSFDPAGIGATSLGDCLALQLQRQPRSEAQMIAIMICKNHLDLLARQDFKKLGAATGADKKLLKEAQSMIVALEPKPARQFSAAEARIIVPDVIVRKNGRHWKAMINPEVLPKLHINDVYARALNGCHSKASLASSPIGLKLQEARWFIRSIQQRFETIQRVSQAIIDRQKNFLIHGAIAMKPMVMREISEELGLHESSISRATTAKYMATPKGTFELKYFFSASLKTDTGGNTSSTAAQALLKQFIDAENPQKPLSDEKLSQLLNQQGIEVARRTVAKYRESMKIPSTPLRKVL
ncbi:MAG: RNA polymerase factor sigma-54 [Burkholderiales bacterium]